MWMMPLHLHVNQKSDYDYDMMIEIRIKTASMFQWNLTQSDTSGKNGGGTDSKNDVIIGFLFQINLKQLFNQLSAVH